MREFVSFGELAAAAGSDLGTSGWITVGQDKVQWFADATGDDHWIHLDSVRSAAAGYGGTLVHGFLTLSLIAEFMGQLFRVDGADLILNYGLDRVRFPAPVQTGSRVRAAATLLEVRPVNGGARITVRYTMWAEGTDKPACVADHHTMQYYAP